MAISHYYNVWPFILIRNVNYYVPFKWSWWVCYFVCYKLNYIKRARLTSSLNLSRHINYILIWIFVIFMVVIKFHISKEILRQLYNFLLPFTQDSLNVWSFETFQLKCQRLWVILNFAKDDDTNKFVTEKTEAVL